MKKRVRFVLVLAVVLILLSVSIYFAVKFLGDKDSGSAGEEGSTPNGTGDASGDGDTEGTGSDGSEESKDPEPEGICLIKDSAALFKIIYTSAASNLEIALAEGLVERLRNLGVSVDDVARDTETKASECEIIIGMDAVGRGDECRINAPYLGARGYTVKAVGKRIVIAAGSPEYADIAVKLFISDILGIKDDTSDIKDIYVKDNLFVEQLTEYSVSSVTVCGIDLSFYALVIDIDEMGNFDTGSIEAFSNELYYNTGYLLSVSENTSDESYKFIIRYTDDAGDSGFRAYVLGADLIVECSYANAFNEAFRMFVSECIFTSGDVVFDSDFSYTDNVRSVFYSDFGAAGDGVTDDYLAIYNAHAYANLCGQDVYADDGAVYCIKNPIYGSVPVKTNVYLGNSKIIIDTASESSLTPIFSIESDFVPMIYNREEINRLFGNVCIERGQKIVSWLSEVLSETSLVRVTDENSQNYIKYGQSCGVKVRDAFITDKDGRVSADTPISFELLSVGKIEIYNISDSPIIFSGGHFETYLLTDNGNPDIVSDTAVIAVRRANVTLSNIKHTRANSGNSGSDLYSSFIEFNLAYNCQVKDLDLLSRGNTGEQFGSSEITVTDSIDVSFVGLKMADADISDGKYGSFIFLGGAKNVEIKNSAISSVDASAGVFGLRMENTHLGSSVLLSGGGFFEAVNTTVLTSDAFITLAGEYGASFRADVSLEGCTLACKRAYNTLLGEEKTEEIILENAYVIKSEYGYSDADYISWNFGYDLYMPTSVNLDSFTFGNGNGYLFYAIGDIAFENSYRITERIIYKNMHSLETVENALAFSALGGIPYINETYADESSE